MIECFALWEFIMTVQLVMLVYLRPCGAEATLGQVRSCMHASHSLEQEELHT